jgi:hypothetical protein
MMRSAVVLSSLLSVVGCAGVSMTPVTPLRSTSTTAQATLVVGEITRPRDLISAAGNPFYASMQLQMAKELEHAGVARAIVPERDLASTGVSGEAFVVRYRIIEDHVIVTRRGMLCVGLLTGFGVVTLIPLAFLGLCTVAAEHDMLVEARVFDATGGKVQHVQDSSSNEMLNVYDTSDLVPISRKEYAVRIVVDRGVFYKTEQNEQLELAKSEAAEAVRQILSASIDDMSHAMTAKASASR